MGNNKLKHILILKHQHNNKMTFYFRRIPWSIFTLMLALSCSFALFMSASHSPYPVLLNTIGLLLFTYFAYTSVHLYFTRRELVIDGTNKCISFIATGMFEHINKYQPFSDFRELRLFKKLNNPSTGKPTILGLLLIDKQNNIYSLGTSELGIFGQSKANQIVENLALITTLSVKYD